MYSACRSRLATERHLSHATAKNLCCTFVSKCQRALSGCGTQHSALLSRVCPIAGEGGVEPAAQWNVTCPLLRLRVFFSQVPLFRGGARLSALSWLALCESLYAYLCRYSYRDCSVKVRRPPDFVCGNMPSAQRLYIVLRQTPRYCAA